MGTKKIRGGKRKHRSKKSPEENGGLDTIQEIVDALSSEIKKSAEKSVRPRTKFAKCEHLVRKFNTLDLFGFDELFVYNVFFLFQFHEFSRQKDPWVTTFSNNYYIHYFEMWPDLCKMMLDEKGIRVAYSSAFKSENNQRDAFRNSKYFRVFPVLGKIEGTRGINLHGHISALTTHPDYRGQGCAAALMDEVERYCEAFV